MKNHLKLKWMLIALTLAFFCAMLAWSDNDVPTLTKDELKAMLDDPDVLVIDVRRAGDWKSSEFMIQKAVREDPGNVASLEKKYPKDKTLVLYCA